MKGYVTLVVMLLAANLVAQAEGLDDQYVQIFNLIQEADTLNKERPNEALAKYLEAQTALQRLKNGSPDWNSSVVSFRLNYLGAKITALSTKVAGNADTFSVASTNAPGTPARAAPPKDWEGQLVTLKDQVRQLQAERVMLEAKLKEAFAVLPAESDPRELARAEEKIRTLLKENELLRFNVEKAKTPAASAVSPKSTDQAEQQLGELKRRLAEQEALAAKLTSEKAALEARASSPKPDTKVLAALRAENELLKKQVASLSAAAASGAKTSGKTGQSAQAQVAALQSDKELLRLQLTALESRVKQLSMSNAAPVAAALTEDAGRIKQLERERDELQKQLALTKEELANAGRAAEAAAAKNSERIKQFEALERERRDLQIQLALAKEAATPAQDMSRLKQLENERDNLQKQLETANQELQTRRSQAPTAQAGLQIPVVAAWASPDVVEARQAPYAPEGLALIKEPSPQVAQAPATETQINPGLEISEQRASHKNAATEDKLGRLTEQIGNLVAAQEAQQRQVDELAKGLGGLRERLLVKPDACYASQQDLKSLADAILSADQKRLSDEGQIHAELVNLGKMLITPPPPKEVTPVAITASPGSEHPTAEERSYEYVIQAGDTLSAISRAYREKNIKVSVDQILKANPGLKPEKLRLGQKILIPAPR